VAHGRGTLIPKVRPIRAAVGKTQRHPLDVFLGHYFPIQIIDAEDCADRFSPETGILFVRPLKNAPFCPIPASDSNFNPQNTKCIPACPVGPADRTGVVKIIAFLGLEPRLNIKYGFNWAGKIEHFSKVSSFKTR
jgi:hypothetical protein